jgi:hypothetical protein
MAREPSGERLVDGLAAPVGFHADHLDDLAPPTDEFGEVDPLRFPKRPCLWTHALGKKLGIATSGTKPAAPFKREPLAGLWHKHYFTPANLPGNLKRKKPRDELARAMFGIDGGANGRDVRDDNKSARYGDGRERGTDRRMDRVSAAGGHELLPVLRQAHR